jgi:FdhE protein
MEIPSFRPPEPTIAFARRAVRFEHLAAKRQPADFLRFMAYLSHAQHAALAQLGGSEHRPWPAPSRRSGFAPLDPRACRLNQQWHETLRIITAEVGRAVTGARVREALSQLGRMDERVLNAWADAVLRCVYDPVDKALAPFLFAALQVHFTAAAALLDPAALERPTPPAALCPACGSPPEVSIVGGAAHLRGSRFVCCALCASQWHMERIRCTYCGRNDKVTYFAPEGQAGIAALRAESCEHCRSYIKIMYLEKDPELDPVADDLASLALDLAMAQQGWSRSAPIPFLAMAKD